MSTVIRPNMPNLSGATGVTGTAERQVVGLPELQESPVQVERVRSGVSSVVLSAVLTGAITIPSAFLLGMAFSQSEYWSNRISGIVWDQVYRENGPFFDWTIAGIPLFLIVAAICAVFLGQLLLFRLRQQERNRWLAVQSDRARMDFLSGDTSDAVMVLGVNGVVCSWNPTCASLTGVSASTIVGKRLSSRVELRRDDGEYVSFDQWPNLLLLPVEVQLYDATGAERWVRCTYKRVLHRGLSQIAAEAEANAQVQRLRTRNRRYLRQVRSDLIRDFSDELLVITGRECSDEHELAQLRQDVDRLAELEAAQRSRVLQLQESLQPMMPVATGTEFGVYYSPSDSTAPTGGDFYDWQILRNGDLHIAVVDVLGNGLDATNNAFAVIHTLRILAFQGTPVERLVREADTLLKAQDEELVATCLCIRYTPTTGKARIASGGHPPALLVRAKGEVDEINASGIPIGWPGAGSEQAREVSLEDSDTLVLYTDGLVEAHRDIVQGISALASTAAVTRFLPPSHLARSLVESALKGAELRDDSLALVLRRTKQRQSDVLPGFRMRGQPSSRDVPQIRRKLAEWAADFPAVGSFAPDLSLITTELLTNAMRYAISYYELRVSLEGSVLVMEVEDDGPCFSPTVFEGDGSGSGETGRGLRMVKSLVDDMHVEQDHGRCIVRLSKRL